MNNRGNLFALLLIGILLLAGLGLFLINLRVKETTPAQSTIAEVGSLEETEEPEQSSLQETDDQEETKEPETEEESLNVVETSSEDLTTEENVISAKEEKTYPALSSADRGPEINFEKLQKMNPDIVAWIQIPGTTINYPVVQGTDNQHYLRYTAANVENAAGALFVDYRQSAGFDWYNTIVYGHNRKDDTMFSQLTRYLSQRFWESYPNITVYLPGETRVYEICAVYISPPVARAYVAVLETKASYQSYLDTMMRLRIYDTGIQVTTDQTLLTLVTCTDDAENRVVVHAVRIQ